MTGYAGMGVWDFMTDWQKTLTGPCKALWCYLQPALVLKGPKPETLHRWDTLNRQRKVVGIGELDNHDSRRIFLGFSVSVFPFHRAFRLIRTHLLTEQPLTGHSATDIALLLDALKKGRAYIALESHRSAMGFSFTITGKYSSATMGEQLPLDNASFLQVTLPDKGRIRVIKDGGTWDESVGTALERPLSEPGCYRVEVWRRTFGRYHPWIYTNPIYVQPTPDLPPGPQDDI